jgi:hypothetical protein
MDPSHENIHLICFALRLISKVTSITIVTNRSAWHHLQRAVHGDLRRYWFPPAVRGSGGPAGRHPGRLPHLVPRSQQVPRPRTWGHCRLGGVSTRQRLCCSGNFNHNLIQNLMLVTIIWPNSSLNLSFLIFYCNFTNEAQKRKTH